MGLRWGIEFNTSNFPAADSELAEVSGKTGYLKFPGHGQRYPNVSEKITNLKFPHGQRYPAFNENSIKFFIKVFVKGRAARFAFKLHWIKRGEISKR